MKPKLIGSISKSVQMLRGTKTMSYVENMEYKVHGEADAAIFICVVQSSRHFIYNDEGSFFKKHH